MNSILKNASSYLPTDDYMQKILHERAVSLAAHVDEEKSINHAIPYIRFKIGGDAQYGVEYSYTKGVAKQTHFKKLACVPAVICGLMNCQGKIVGVVDLEKLLGLPEKAEKNNAVHHVIVLSVGDMMLGIKVGEIEMSDAFDTDSLAKAKFFEMANEQAFIKCIDKGRVSILNVESIFSSINAVVGEIL